MSAEKQSSESSRSEHEVFPVGAHAKAVMWTSLVIVCLVAFAAGVICALKAKGMLPEEYTYYNIFIDSVVVPCAFYFSMIVLGLGREVTEYYVQRMSGPVSMKIQAPD